MDASALGPAPTPGGPALSPARARVAELLDRSGGGVTVAALAERLGGHPNATRAHLDGLVAKGLATAAPVRGTGRGRPALSYTLTEAGRRALTPDPTRVAYAELASAFASHLADTPDAEPRARSIGRSWGATRVQSGSRPAMLHLLSDLGFDPEPDADAIRLRSCPLLDAATAHPEVVCAIHAGLIEGALGRTGVELEPFAEPGACLVRGA